MANVDYTVDYSDKRFQEVENNKNQALADLNKTYDTMIDSSNQYYQAQIDASKQWVETQQQNQQAQTDFALEKLEQQKDQTQKDYIKEQSGAYVDWQKQSNQYGVNAEAMAAQGMTNTGYSESSQVSMYNTYQNRVATAREAYTRAVLNYDNAMKDAQLQNSSALAEIAFQGLQNQLELSLAGFNYKNQLILEKTNKTTEIEQLYNNRYQDVLDQINRENALAEEIRQYNENMALQQQKLAEEQRQYNENLALQREQLAEEKRQFNANSGSGVVAGGVVSGGYDVKAAQQFVGTTADGIWGKNSIAAAKSKGYNSLEEVIAAMNNVNSNGYSKASGTGYGTYTEARDAVKEMRASGATDAQLRAAIKEEKDAGNLSKEDYNRLLTYIKNTSK